MFKSQQAQTIFNELRGQFARIGIDTPDLDARLLLEFASGIDQIKMIVDPLIELSSGQQKHLEGLVARRIAFEPIAKIIGEKEFYGRPFKVNQHVLDPRPDTETLIDTVLENEGEKPSAFFLDIGTGSGVIAITLLCENAGWKGVASDISDLALKVARQNSQVLAVSDRLTFQQTVWAQGIDQKFDFIVSNPPYIESAEILTLRKDVKNYDPHLALDGGPDGLQPYRDIALTCSALLKFDGCIYLEIGASQAEQVVEIFERHGFCNPYGKHEKNVFRDLVGNDRVVVMQWNGKKQLENLS